MVYPHLAAECPNTVTSHEDDYHADGHHTISPPGNLFDVLQCPPHIHAKRAEGQTQKQGQPCPGDEERPRDEFEIQNAT